MKFTKAPWLVFTVGFVAVVDAENNADARRQFRERHARAHGGRSFAFADEELRARPLRLDDEDWIVSQCVSESYGDRAARAGLAHLKETSGSHV